MTRAQQGDPADWLERNRNNWEERVPIHAASSFYDLPGFRAGADPLPDYEVEELGDVRGRRLLHLQCHIGLDTLAWARRGALVTGLDFSPSAVATARATAEEIGLPQARFVASDVYQADTALDGETFDIVSTGVGALCWLPDLTGWAQVVARLTAPGGCCYVNEFHPVVDMLDEDGVAVTRSYFERAGTVEDYPYTYTDGAPLAQHTETVQWSHPLGDVVTALASAGLRIEFLRERDAILFQRYPTLVRDGAWYRFPADQPKVPLMYSLRASKPADG